MNFCSWIDNTHRRSCFSPDLVQATTTKSRKETTDAITIDFAEHGKRPACLSGLCQNGGVLAFVWDLDQHEYRRVVSLFGANTCPTITYWLATQKETT